MNGLNLVKPGHGSMKVDLDPGLKIATKNGRATVYVDHVVWAKREAMDAIMTELETAKKERDTLLARNSGLTRNNAILDNQRIVAMDMNQSLRDHIASLKSWCITWTVIAIGCFGVAAWAIWVRP